MTIVFDVFVDLIIVAVNKILSYSLGSFRRNPDCTVSFGECGLFFHSTDLVIHLTNYKCAGIGNRLRSSSDPHQFLGYRLPLKQMFVFL